MKHDIEKLKEAYIRKIGNAEPPLIKPDFERDLDHLCQAVAENALPEGYQAVKKLPPLPEGYDGIELGTPERGGWYLYPDGVWGKCGGLRKEKCLVATKSKPAGWTGLELLRERGVLGEVMYGRDGNAYHSTTSGNEWVNKGATGWDYEHAITEVEYLCEALGIDPDAITYVGDPADSLVRIG